MGRFCGWIIGALVFAGAASLPRGPDAVAEDASDAAASSGAASRPAWRPDAELGAAARALADAWGAIDASESAWVGSPTALEFLLRAARVTAGSPASPSHPAPSPPPSPPPLDATLRSALHTLADSPAHDSRSPGFLLFRDRRTWDQPEPIKRLALNAQMAGVYEEAFRLTGDSRFAAVARAALDCVLQLRTQRHVMQRAIGKPESDAEGSTAPPRIDREVSTAANGLAISVLARAGRTFGDEAYLRAAAGAADFMLREFFDDQGRLIHHWSEADFDRRAAAATTRGERHAKPAAAPAKLEDYAFFIAGLLDLFECTQRPRWLERALDLQRQLDSAHWRATHQDIALGDATRGDATSGRYSFEPETTPSSGSSDPSSSGEHADAEILDGDACATSNLVRLHALTDDPSFHDRATQILERLATPAFTRVTAAPRIASALDGYCRPPCRVFIVRKGPDDDIVPFLTVLTTNLEPPRVTVVTTAGVAAELLARLVPALVGKDARLGRPTAYVVSTQRTSSEPLFTAEALAAELAKLRAGRQDVAQ
ncbi:MAG: hypothetical protein AB7O52_17780 [Planctomycetota bacterium]